MGKNNCKNLILLYISRRVDFQPDSFFGTADSEPIFPNMWFSGGLLENGCGKGVSETCEIQDFPQESGTTSCGSLSRHWTSGVTPSHMAIAY